MTQSSAKADAIIEDFVRACHRHFTCFVFATLGFKGQLEVFAASPPGARFYIGDGPPDAVSQTAVQDIDSLRLFCRKDGEFTDTIAKAILVLIYSEWDEYYRNKIAKAYSCQTTDVNCDLMGDLRLIRNVIVHNKSDKNKNLEFKKLDWSNIKNGIVITSAMMTSFIKEVNRIEMTISAPQS